MRRRRRIKVKIPAGIDTGQLLRLAGEGEAGGRGAPRGDLYVAIEVKPHPVFAREGDDLHCEIPIGFAQAALGAEVKAPSLVGGVRLKIPSGTQSGTIFRMKGRGMPRLDVGGSGDELIRVVVKTPTKLSGKQKELLKEFAKETGEDVHSGKHIF